jgi:PAS domain S-box-containing protein
LLFNSKYLKKTKKINHPPPYFSVDDMKLEDDIQQETDIFQKAIGLAKENQKLAREREQAEEELKRATRQKELILNSAGEGIYGLDLEGNTTFANPAAEKMLGYTEEELLGKPQHAIIHHSKPDGSPYPREDCHIYATFNDGKVHRESEEVFWRKDGTCFPVEYVSTPILEDEKLIGAVVTFRDITERKIAEQAEEQIKNLAKFCMENPNPVLRIKEEGRLLFSNPPALVLLNDGAIKTGDQVPPEFQKMVSLALSLQSIQQSEIQVGIQSFHLKWVPIFDKGYVNIYGEDITERKKAEQALLESEARANAVLNNALDGIITINEHGIINSFNPAAEKLFGYKAPEILGKTVNGLIPENFRSAHEQGLKNYLATGTSKIIGIGREAMGLRKDGSTFPMDLGISEMYLGETRMFTGIVRDITERKKAEAQNLL